MMSSCFELGAGRTRYCMSRYQKDEIFGHIQNHKVCSLHAKMTSAQICFSIMLNIFQPTHVILYPLFASWLVRSLELAQHDFSFIKVVMIGGGTIDPTTFDLLKKHMPSTFVSLVC
jgi:hypothetical protein